jgi:hypothetical protein
VELLVKYCTNCGKAVVAGMKFCSSCGTKLVQESAITSDIQSEVEPSIGPPVNQGLQQRPRSAALKWVTGILFLLTAIYLFSLINLIYLLQAGYEVPFFIGDFIAFPLALAAAICAMKRSHWRYVRGVAIWLVISTIIGALFLLASGEIGLWLPEDITLVLFVFLAEVTCLILISKTRAEFS